MNLTTLNLLTRDGAVAVLIVPALDAEHYAELHEIVRHADTADELRAAVPAACDRWDRVVHFGWAAFCGRVLHHDYHEIQILRSKLHTFCNSRFSQNPGKSHIVLENHVVYTKWIRGSSPLPPTISH